ncbi:MAG: NADH-quinone oxidoreductase subunit J [Dehalococcoidales bacterium]|nr:NADH-quinone oxidoreductase subunit J [Dehalococcoidales bacterium]
MVMDLIFWALAILTVGTALAVVLLRDIFRAALALVACFLVVAGIYITLNADFLAAVQVLIYIGGISVLIVLAIMLTRDVQHGSQANRLRIPALITAGLFFAVITVALTGTTWQISSEAPAIPTTPVLAERLFGSNGFILPVEIAAVLLLAVMLGAIVLMREK